MSGSIAFAKALLDPSSPFLRRRHVESVRYSTLLGIPLGLAFILLSRYYEYTSFLLSVILLGFVIYYYLLRRSLSFFYMFRIGWSSRETVRSRFMHLAITSAIAAIVTMFFWLNIFSVPYLTQVPASIPVMIALVASIAAIFALTSFVPKLDILYCLIYDFVQTSYLQNPGTWFELEDTDFPGIITGTAFTNAEVVDAFESLRKEGYVERMPNAVLGRVRYRIYPEGISFLAHSSHDVRGRIETTMRQVDILMEILDGQVNGAKPLENHYIQDAMKELMILRMKIQKLIEEYGRLVPREWSSSSLKKIHQLELDIREQRSSKAVVEA
ncbi:MAG: hypothetical protein QXV84_00010 [Conexivisphaerales archaeon]